MSDLNPRHDALCKSNMPGRECNCGLDSLRARVAKMERLISDDSFAITFQTLGQYRSALLKALRG